jgi:6-phosphofructokinase
MPGSAHRIGVFVAGGPAAGINGVIKGVAQAAGHAGLEVVGFRGGPRGLVNNQYVHLTRQAIEDIDLLGGSVLGASRYRIDEAAGDLERITANLQRAGIQGLVSIGGEGTLQLADVLRRTGIPIVHVPKTIDNDIAGVDTTFGFSTAVHVATRMLSVVKLDAKTTSSWFVVEIMGRNTGHLALEAGLAAGCTRVLIPEEGPINVAELATLIATRGRCGRPWGIVLVAEAAHFGDGPITSYGRLGGVANVLAERLQVACQLQQIECKIRTSNLGYFLRCAEPVGYDRAYALQLGWGAVQCLRDPASEGHMVTIKDDTVVPVPMAAVAGQTKRVDLNGTRYRALQAISEFEAAGAELAGQQATLARAAEALGWLDNHASMSTLEGLAMRLGVPITDLLSALRDLERTAAHGRSTTAPCADDAPAP